MEVSTMIGLASMGGAMALGFAAIGSALGTGTAGMAGIGAWKKCYLQGKAAPFILLVFIGAPLSQTIYGLLLLGTITKATNVITYLPKEAVKIAKEAAKAAGNSKEWLAEISPDVLAVAQQALADAMTLWPAMLGAGLIGGIAMGMSAWYQGKAGAAGSDALAETGQGFANYLTTLGIVETVALFVMIFIAGAF